MSNINLDFACIGIQKSATSYLFNVLKNSKEICLPNKKWERYYLDGKKIQSVENLFELKQGGLDANRIIGDVSVEYITNKSALEYLKNISPNIKIIVCVRDHVSRLISAYNWYFRKGKTNSTLKEFFSLQNQNDKELILKYGVYYDYLDFVFKNFKNVYILEYDLLKANTSRVLNDVRLFLELNEELDENVQKPKPRINSAILMYLVRKLSINPAMSNVLEKLIELIPHSKKTNPEEEIYLGKELAEIFADDAKKCNSLFLQFGYDIRLPYEFSID